MKIKLLILFVSISISCNQSYPTESSIVADTTAIPVETVSSSEVNPILTQTLDVKTFSGKTFLSGTAHQLFFEDDENVSITFERYYDGSWGKHSINGKYSIVGENQIKVNWIETNTVSWLNTWGECGMQTVNQSESFSNVLSYNTSLNCVSVNTTFNQSFYAGNRCGNEDKTDNRSYEFCLN
jgi:hypothetical protein